MGAVFEEVLLFGLATQGVGLTSGITLSLTPTIILGLQRAYAWSSAVMFVFPYEYAFQCINRGHILLAL